MRKKSWFLLTLATLITVRFCYVPYKDDYIDFYSRVMRGEAFEKRQRVEKFACGVIGEWVYKFPQSLVGAMVGFFGDDPWVGKMQLYDRGCSDQMSGILVRMCEPDFRLISYFGGDRDRCYVSLRMSPTFNENYLEDALARKKASQIHEGKKGYDEALGLNYFDAKTIGFERVFWREATAHRPLVLGDCSLKTAVSVCEFVTYSQELSASIRVGFTVDRIKNWQVFLTSAEQHLAIYKFKKFEDE